MFILQSLHLSPCLLFPFIIWLQTSHEVMFLKVYSANWWLVSRTGGGSTLTLKISNFKTKTTWDQLDHSVHLLNMKIKTSRTEKGQMFEQWHKKKFFSRWFLTRTHSTTPVTKLSLTALGAFPPPGVCTWLLLGWLPFTFLKAFTHLLLIRPVTLALKSIEFHKKKTKESHIFVFCSRHIHCRQTQTTNVAIKIGRKNYLAPPLWTAIRLSSSCFTVLSNNRF